MATKFKKDDMVKVNTVVPNGPVKALRMDDDGVVHCLVEWVDMNGVTQKRWFAEDDLVAG